MVRHHGTDEWDRTIGLIARLTGPDATARPVALDEVTDVLSGLTEMESLALSYVLAGLARLEEDEQCLEAQLHALAMMAEDAMLLSSVIDHVLAIDRSALRGSCVEHYDFLLETAGST